MQTDRRNWQQKTLLYPVIAYRRDVRLISRRLPQLDRPTKVCAYRSERTGNLRNGVIPIWHTPRYSHIKDEILNNKVKRSLEDNQTMFRSTMYNTVPMRGLTLRGLDHGTTHHMTNKLQQEQQAERRHKHAGQTKAVQVHRLVVTKNKEMLQ